MKLLRPGLLLVAGALAMAFYACGGGGDDAADNEQVIEGTGGSAQGEDAGTDGPQFQFEDTGPSTEPVDRDASCADTVVKGDLKPANLLFVVDRSGSMNCNLPEDGQTTQECQLMAVAEDDTLPTKWELTEAALENALSELADGGNINAGILMFPGVGATKCFVADEPDLPVAELTDNHLDDLTTFLSAEDTEPKGATPLAEATLIGYQHLYDLLADGGKVNNQFVVLLTDGRPSTEDCPSDALDKLIDDGRAEAAVEQLNIRTFVIGVPGSEDGRSILSELAYLGGTASSDDCDHGSDEDDEGDCHVDLTQSTDFAADLQERLNEIRGRVSKCAFDVPEAEDGKEADPTKINVIVNDEIIEPDQSASCLGGADGWQYSEDRTQILLCGDACDEAQEEDAVVEIIIGCATQVT